MEEASSPPAPPPCPRPLPVSTSADVEHVRVRRRALRAVLENCRMALELLEDPDLGPDPTTPDAEDGLRRQSRPAMDSDTDELCSLLESKVESSNFLEKLGSIQMSVCQKINEDDNASWNMVTAMDLWEEKQLDGENDPDYVFVSQEDITESIACFMAAYLSSLKQTKDLTPNQLQEALCKAFSIKKRKSRLRKAWEGCQIVYNIASWGATAAGVYHNPAILETASVAIWSSCRAVAKLF